MATKVIRGIEIETRLNEKGVECAILYFPHKSKKEELLPLNHPKVQMMIDNEIALAT